MFSTLWLWSYLKSYNCVWWIISTFPNKSASCHRLVRQTMAFGQKNRSETFSCWTPMCQDYRWNIISSDPRAKIKFLKVKSKAGKIHLRAPAVTGCRINIKGRFSSAGFKTESPRGCAGGIMDFFNFLTSFPAPGMGRWDTWTAHSCYAHSAAVVSTSSCLYLQNVT